MQLHQSNERLLVELVLRLSFGSRLAFFLFFLLRLWLNLSALENREEFLLAVKGDT